MLKFFLGNACGFYPNEDYYFYNLFRQTNIISKSLYPFIKGGNNQNDSKNIDKKRDYGNQELWSQLSKNNPAVKKYWNYVNSFDSLAFSYTNTSWDYNAIIRELIEPGPFIDEGFKLFKLEKNKQLKTRYAYQIIKLMFYSKRFDDAIKFFDNYVLPLNEKNEIFYYTMNLVGGCYYRLEEYDKAAYYYILVFYNSKDKKSSSYLSYIFCTDKNKEGKPFIKDVEEKEAYVVLKSIRKFSDSFQGLEELYEINPNSDYLELLFVRSLILIEKNGLPRVTIETKTIPYLDNKSHKRIKKLFLISEEMYKNGKSKDRDFWELANSYLFFLSDDINKANLLLNNVKDERFAEQKKSLLAIYKVFSWEEIGKEEEQYLTTIIESNRRYYKYYRHLYPRPSDIIWEKVSHTYLKFNQLAKSFLVNNKVEGVERIFSLALIDDLIKLVEKTNKSDFENYLIEKRCNNISVKDLLFIKGMYYLHDSNLKMAAKYLKARPNKSTTNWWIFSNNIVEQELTSYSKSVSALIEQAMTDSIARIPLFSFINDAFSKYDLATYLMKLNLITHAPDRNNRKFAHYLLGNYYYNISNSGLFRYDIVDRKPYNNFRMYFYSPHRKRIFTDVAITNKTAYNLSEASTYLQLYFGFAKKAMQHYEIVLSLSDDKELNARTLYMMAKCELNDMYNSSDEYYDKLYDGTLNKKTIKYKRSFKRLKNEYSDTKFHEMIIKECSFFKYYCSQ